MKRRRDSARKQTRRTSEERVVDLVMEDCNNELTCSLPNSDQVPAIIEEIERIGKEHIENLEGALQSLATLSNRLCSLRESVIGLHTLKSHFIPPVNVEAILEGFRTSDTERAFGNRELIFFWQVDLWRSLYQTSTPMFMRLRYEPTQQFCAPPTISGQIKAAMRGVPKSFIPLSAFEMIVYQYATSQDLCFDTPLCKVGGSSCTREDFHSMSPRCTISTKIVDCYMALLSLDACKDWSTTQDWYLHWQASHFRCQQWDDEFSPTLQLSDSYTLPLYRDCKKIFVPIKDGDFVWNFILISLPNKTVSVIRRESEEPDGKAVKDTVVRVFHKLASVAGGQGNVDYFPDWPIEFINPIQNSRRICCEDWGVFLLDYVKGIGTGNIIVSLKCSYYFRIKMVVDMLMHDGSTTRGHFLKSLNSYLFRQATPSGPFQESADEPRID